MRVAQERSRYKNLKSTDLRDVDLIELKSFLGLLLFTSIFKSNTEDIRSIFATDGSGRDIFRCVTNANRFAILLICLRFDNAVNREKRRQNDPVALVSEVFNIFVKNCQKAYTLGTGVCIDEMLIAFRGRSKFKMYMPKKPAKYGLKVMALTDARTGYFFNGYIYAGRDSDGITLSAEDKKYNKPTQAVLRLSEPLYNSNRNITADNWFSSVELVNALKSKKLTYVGTLKKNKREIPKEFQASKSREVGTSLYGYTKDMTLLSYVTKKNMAVLLISSQHHFPYDDPVSNKPEIIDYYNYNKGGVDALDEKCTKYSTSRRTSRWPMAIFFRILDIASANSYILFGSFRDNPTISRYDFVKELAMKLVTPELERRVANSHINREIRSCIRRVLKIKEEFPNIANDDGKLEKRKTCSICPPAKKRKTAYCCCSCKRAICLECSKKICSECCL